MTYRPGDTFTKKLPLTEEGVSVTATVERNGSAESGTGITSVVTGQICTVTMAIPDTWAAGDHVSITLTATLDDETSYEVIEFMLESQRLSAVASQASVEALPTVADIDGLGTLEKQEEILTAVGNIESGSVPEETIEKIDFIYEKFTYIPPDRGVVLVPDASDPEMVVLVVQLRDAPNMVNGLKATATMLEPGPVYLDYAWEVKKEYDDVTGEHTDANGTHQGVANIELFSSPKLEAAGYNGLYQVVAPGVRRTVWVPEGGGRLGELPETKPEE